MNEELALLIEDMKSDGRSVEEITAFIEKYEAEKEAEKQKNKLPKADITDQQFSGKKTQDSQKQGAPVESQTAAPESTESKSEDISSESYTSPIGLPEDVDVEVKTQANVIVGGQQTTTKDLQGYYDTYRQEGETNADLMERITPKEIPAAVFNPQLLEDPAVSQSYMGSDVKKFGNLPHIEIDGVIYNPNIFLGQGAYTLTDGSPASEEDIQKHKELSLLYTYQEQNPADAVRGQVIKDVGLEKAAEMSDIQIKDVLKKPSDLDYITSQGQDDLEAAENEFDYKDYQNLKIEKTTNDFSVYIAKEASKLEAQMQAEFERKVANLNTQEEADALAKQMQEDYALKFQQLQDEQWKVWSESYKPEYSLWNGKLEDINAMLDDAGFYELDRDQKRIALSNILEQQMRTMQEGGKVVPNEEDMRNEFYSYFFDNLYTNEEGQYTQFAMKDMATTIGNEAEKKLEAYYKELKEKGTIDGKDSALMRMPDGRPVPIFYTDGELERYVRNLFPELALSVEYRDDILDNPETLGESGFINFFRGLGGKKGYTYVPFGGSVIDMGNSLDALILANKEDRTQEEENALVLYQLNQMSQQKSNELSTSYKAGNMAAQSLPFMIEFIATAGYFTAAKEGMEKTIKEIASSYIKKRIKKNIAKGTLGSSKVLFDSAKFKVSKGIQKTVAVTVGALTQTAVNPSRYLDQTFQNMTPEMVFAYSDEADGLINTITKQGDSFPKAFAKGFATTSLENLTERMGFLAPSLVGKLITKAGADDFLKRISLGRYMRKLNLSKSEALLDVVKKRAGWNGILGEISEEMYNIPLSNLVNGQGFGFAGFTMDDFKAMALSISATAGGFYGAGVGMNAIRGRKSPTYIVDYQRFQTKQEALSRLQQLQLEGKLDANTDIEIKNDFGAFDEVSSFLEENGLSNEIIKTDGLSISDGLTATSEVEMLNEIESKELRKQLEEISEEIGIQEQKKTEILNSKTLNNQEKNAQIAAVEQIDAYLAELVNAKETILAPVKEAITNYKKEERYQIQLANAKRAQEQLNKVAPIKTRFVETKDEEDAAQMMREDVLLGSGLVEIRDGVYVDMNTGNEVVLTPQQEAEIQRIVDEGKTSHGYVSSFTNEATGERLLIINKTAALEGKGMNVASHEFFHEFLRKSLRDNPAMAVAIGNALRDELLRIDPRQVRDTDFRARLAAYQDMPAEVRAEETLALFSDALANGTMQYKETFFTKLGDMIRRIMLHLGVPVKFKTGRDVFNFIRDYNKAIESKRGLSRGLIITALQGAKIEGAIKADAKAISDMLDDFNKKYETYLRETDPKDLDENQLQALERVQQGEKVLDINSLEQMGMRFSKEGIPAERLTKEELAKAVNDMMAPLVNLKKKRNDGTITEQEERMLERMEADIPGRAAFFYMGMAQDAFARALNNAPTEDIRRDLIDNKDDIIALLLYDPGTEGAKGRTVVALLKDFDPAKHKYENAAAYVNQFFKKRSLEIFARRGVEDVAAKSIERDEAAKKKAEGMTGPSSDTVEAKGKGRVLGADLGLHEYDENGNRIDALRKEADRQLDILLEQESPSFAESPSFTAPFISELSGVPANKITDKAANLNQHLGPARRFNAKHKDMLIAMRPRHYTVKMVNVGTVANPVYEARPDKAIGIPNKIKKLGYNKGRRKANLTPWHIKSISSSEFDNFIAPRNPDGTVNENDRNIEQNNKGWLSLLDKVMSNQELRMAALDRGLPMEWIGRMRDGNSNYLFSKEVRALGIDNEAVFYGRLSEFGSEPMTADVKSIQEALMRVYPDIMTRGTAGKIAKELSKFIKQYQNIEKSFIGLGKIPPRSFEEFLADNVNLPEFNITRLLEVKQDGKLMKNSELYDNIDFVKNQRASVVDMGNYMIQDLKMKPEEVIRYMLAYLKPMYAGASKIGRGAIGVREDGTLYYKEGFEGGTPRGMVFESVRDFIENGVNKIDGINIDLSKVTDAGGSIQNKKMIEVYGADVTALPQSAKGMMNKHNKLGKEKFFEAVDKETKEVRQLIDVMMRYFVGRVKDGSLGRNDLAMMMLSLNAGLDTPMRRAANLAYIGRDVENMDPSKMTSSTVAYEHMIPANYMAVKLLDQYMNKGGIEDLDAFYKNYNVAIISAKMDDVLKKQGLLSMMPVGYDINTPAWIRYYNFRTQGFKDIVGLTALDPRAQDIDVADAFTKANEILIDNPNELQVKKNYDKAIINARLHSKETPSRGMSTFDFDETLIDKGENFIIAKKDGQEVKISSGQWPLQGPQYAADGWTFDFTDFVNVRGGIEGPLLQKMRNQIEKYGPENVYVLTARPAESATAIHGWLKTKGINIPLKNITGLGNGTGDAKAAWFLEKYAEGYNDMYFVDDALPNVEAVKHVFNQLDIKGKSVIVRPRYSLDPESKLNEMLERSKGVDRNQTFNRVQARNKGKGNRIRQLFIPPSADDFEGLMYYNLGKGDQGNIDAKFFKDMFYDPYNRADRELDMYKQTLREDVMAIKKQFPKVAKKLNKDFAKTGYTNEQAMRIYIYNKYGYEVPGMSFEEVTAIAEAVAADSEMAAFADLMDKAMKMDFYVQPRLGWNASSFNGDMADAARAKREIFLQEWVENIDATFTPEMLNKLEAIHGSGYRSALEDSIARMKSGTNRPTIKNKQVNNFLDWLNGSVGAIMFFNARSAVLQTLSTVNFINFEDNNVFAAARAFGNQKQYWADFVFLFNSPMLKQRRGGIQSDLNASELARLAEKGGVRAVIGRLLQFGFTPTQIADSFAISAGGATYYRNRVDKYVKEGMSQTEAETRAFEDFQEIAEATQQSSRPDKISQEQASVLGRLILAFQNTPMQYNRLIKKAALDLINGRGDWRSNVSRIIYYGAAQNIIFSALQNALFAVMFDDDDQDDEFLDTKVQRIGNSTLDSLLRGSGIYGAILSTAKNTIMRFMYEREKGKRADHGRTLVEALNVSPPLGSKARKMYSAMTTDKWDKDIYDKIPLYNIDNPIWAAAGNVVEALTNIPAGRIQRKISNLKAALDNETATWQRLALFLGWDKWGLGLEEAEEIKQAEEEVKKEKKKDKKKTKDTVDAEKEQQFLQDQKREREDTDKVRCAAVTRDGDRCSNEALPGQNYCTIHAKTEKRSDGKEVQCKKIKSDGNRCKMKTKNKSGLCYYHD